jgi:glutathione S-transferase
MPEPTLVGLHYSPWTQRARWALDHHRVRHRYREYLPVVGEPGLRLASRRWTGKTSVPVLLTPHGAIFDSLAIARHVDSFGQGEKLCDGHEAAVNRWIELAEPALHAARGLVMLAVDRDREAQLESVKLPMPAALKGPTARFGSAVLRWKWSAATTEREGEAKLAEVAEQLRQALAGNAYLDGSFSFADVIAAGVVQAIAPVGDRYLPLEPATRRAWTRPALAARFSDLLEWRDRLFARHR